MFDWSRHFLPERVRAGLDYALVSWWPEDCAAPAPDWNEVFSLLGEIYPGAMLGMGEAGASSPQAKLDQARWCYTLDVDHPRFIGGCFWWTFRQDMVPAQRPLWQLLESISYPADP